MRAGDSPLTDDQRTRLARIERSLDALRPWGTSKDGMLVVGPAVEG
jgi:hypothetical protein